MDIKPQIYTAKVMHKRLFPKINTFTYNVYYLALPLTQMKQSADNGLAINRFSPLSFYNCDHAQHLPENNLEDWIINILKEYDLDKHVENVVLVTMPRVFGYVFNPVSFWICLDDQGHIRAVLNEVNNTFGESHSYLCAKKDGAVISNKDWMQANKVFHVSPFLEREGHYKFRFDLEGNRLGIWIDFYDKSENKKLITSLTGTLIPLTQKNLRYVFWRYPLVTLKSIYLIHWQAIKVFFKRARYFKKPKAINPNLSTTDNLTKM